ncbi:MAG TPA: hypothetical protein PLZ86_07140 [bacterium]|nr:hypothetical protein [bacterium]
MALGEGIFKRSNFPSIPSLTQPAARVYLFFLRVFFAGFFAEGLARSVSSVRMSFAERPVILESALRSDDFLFAFSLDAFVLILFFVFFFATIVYLPLGYQRKLNAALQVVNARVLIIDREDVAIRRKRCMLTR